MANEDKKDFNAMLMDSKDMPKVQIITDEKSIEKYGGDKMYFAPPIDYDKVMRLVPCGKLLTVGTIRDYFAKQSGADFTEPITAGIFVSIVAWASYQRAEDKTPYWRTLKANGELNAKYPGGVEAQKEMVGWIKVEDTNINYPVVQSVNEPNFYLKHRFDKNYSAYGCPYVQENCDVQKPSDNIIIYGHHMNDGSMFTGLMKYRNKSFWEGHKTITFDTLTDRHQYEVIAVFKTVVYTNSSDSFKYYEFTDAENVAEFDAYVAKCKELSLYDTGVSAEYGDKLISLSTCEYSRNNGRLVVVAKRVD